MFLDPVKFAQLVAQLFAVTDELFAQSLLKAFMHYAVTSIALLEALILHSFHRPLAVNVSERA